MNHRISRSIESSGEARFSRGWRLVSCSLAASAVLVTLAGSAAAETTIGIDLSYNDTVDQSGTDPGAGVDLYFGPRLDLTLLTLTTELSGGFHDFGGVVDPTVYRALVGGRLGIGVGIRPNVFAHLGVGHLRYDDILGLDREGRTNFAGDVGVALDFTLLPVIDIGIQASYNIIAGGSDSDAFKWLQGGAHVIFVLDSDS
jgi:hypothetical protein